MVRENTSEATVHVQLYTKMDNDREDELDRSCENEKVLYRVKKEMNILHTKKEEELTVFIRSFTSFSVFPYTGQVPRMWKLSQ